MIFQIDRKFFINFIKETIENLEYKKYTLFKKIQKISQNSL